MVYNADRISTADMDALARSNRRRQGEPPRTDLREMADVLRQRLGLRVHDIDGIVERAAARPLRDPNAHLQPAPKLPDDVLARVARQAAARAGARLPQ